MLTSTDKTCSPCWSFFFTRLALRHPAFSYRTVFVFACAFFAVLFFDLTNNIIVTSLIVLGGGFMLSVLLNCAIMIGRFTINKEFLGKVFLGSRILGGITNLV